MLTLHLLLLVLSLVLLVLAGVGIGHPRAHLGWLGLAAYVAAALLP